MKITKKKTENKKLAVPREGFVHVDKMLKVNDNT